MTFEKAVEIAARAHAGQLDKQQEPYLLHVLRVGLGVGPDARVVAVLHDVLEDTNVSEAELRSEGVSETELAALKLLTRDKHSESYEEFIDRIAIAGGRAGELARETKLADLRDNLARITDDLSDLEQRYRDALGRLGSANGGPGPPPTRIREERPS